MAVALKLGLLSIVPSVLSLGLVSAVKTSVGPVDMSTNLVRREGYQMTRDNNGSDHSQDYPPAKMQVVLGSDALLSAGGLHETNHKVAEAKATYTQFVGYCELHGSNYEDNDEVYVGNGKSQGEMESLCDADEDCTGFQMNGGSWRGLMVGPTPTGGDGSGSNKCFAKVVGTAPAPAPISADVQNCMNKLHCFASMSGSMTDAEFQDFKCKCILNIAVDGADTITCQDWIDCLQDPNPSFESFQARMLQVLYQLRFPYNQGISQASLLLQQSSHNDVDGCIHPNAIDEELLECSCWDRLKTLCPSHNQGNELFECIRLEMCKAPPEDICHSWKVGAGGVESQCSPDEINPPSTLLVVQDTQQAERAVLADIFQGRRQMPKNISEIGAAALEGSMRSKACN